MAERGREGGRGIMSLSFGGHRSLNEFTQSVLNLFIRHTRDRNWGEATYRGISSWLLACGWDLV